MVQKDDNIYIFYVDNIVFILPKDQHDKIEKTIALLSKALTIETKGELK